MYNMLKHEIVPGNYVFVLSIIFLWDHDLYIDLTLIPGARCTIKMPCNCGYVCCWVCSDLADV